MQSSDMYRPPIRRARLRMLIEIIRTVVFVGAVFVLFQMTIPRSVVDGRSMEPTFLDGQRLVISRLNYIMGEPQRGDIAVFNSPRPLRADEPPLIKRVIGVPGDVVEIRDRQVYVNDELLDEPYVTEPCRASCRDDRWELGDGEYFMMGDNRNHSRDSRVFGAVRRSQIIGEVILRFWPLANIGVIRAYHYD